MRRPIFRLAVPLLSGVIMSLPCAGGLCAPHTASAQVNAPAGRPPHGGGPSGGNPSGGGGPRHPDGGHSGSTIVGGPAVIDVNRPLSPFDCELPNGIDWYGSEARCLAYLCAGHNVYNEYIFDRDNRRRRNPCYGQSPTDFPE